mmetsp:Transcript_6155/g.9279  ORF Transcript_6155/g.9279 Transcript_6155/m.9279 type:complete len:82 (+) Transcript_6155:208-453(+)
MVHDGESAVPGPTPPQLAAGALMLGASASLALYARRTSQLLSHMNKLSAADAKRKVATAKAGPLTRREWERTRTRIGDDEF